MQEAEATTTYQSMRPLSSAGSVESANSNSVSVKVSSDGDDAPSQSAWRRVLRDYRVAEFACTVIMYILALVFSLIEVNERPIPGIRVQVNSTTTYWALDPDLNQPKLREHVPMWALLTFGLGLPIGTNLVVNYVLPRMSNVRVIPHDTRDFLLSLLQSMALAEFFTQFTKNITGRFRPCFYDMCKWNHDVVWDGVTSLCTDSAGEKEGRKSFPSGHASFAWSTMLVLTLYLLGRARLNCENRSISAIRGAKKSLLLFMCCAPALLAAWVAVTRSIDNWHHYSDIIAGTIIGAVSAVFATDYNYGSIWVWDSAGLPLEEIHERRMAKKDFNFDDALEMQLKHNTSRNDLIVDLSNRGRNASE